MLLCFRRFRIEVVLRVRERLVDNEFGMAIGKQQLFVHAHGVAQKEVTRAREKERGRELRYRRIFRVDGGEERILHVPL